MKVQDIPVSESLKDLIDYRTVPFWKSIVEPQIVGKFIPKLIIGIYKKNLWISAGETILCVAHGTSLRGIVKHIEKLSEYEITKIDLPNGIPIVYRWEVLKILIHDVSKYLLFIRLDNNLNILRSREYLADDMKIDKALKKVSNIMLK